MVQHIDRNDKTLQRGRTADGAEMGFQQETKDPSRFPLQRGRTADGAEMPRIGPADAPFRRCFNGAAPRTVRR